jgi:hypothetical protein
MTKAFGGSFCARMAVGLRMSTLVSDEGDEGPWPPAEDCTQADMLRAAQAQAAGRRECLLQALAAGASACCAALEALDAAAALALLRARPRHKRHKACGSQQSGSPWRHKQQQSSFTACARLHGGAAATASS